MTLKQQINQMIKVLADNGVRLTPDYIKRSDEDQLKLLNKIFREMVA